MNVVMHPSAVGRGLENARAIMRNADGLYEDAEVLDACEYLIAHGDWLDAAGATQLRDFLVGQYVADLNRMGREWDEGVLYSAPEPPITLFEIIVVAYAVIMIATSLIGAAL